MEPIVLHSLQLLKWREWTVPTKPRAAKQTPEFLTVAEVAQITRQSSAKVYADAASGALPSYRFGTTVRIDRADFQDYIAARRVSE